MASGGGGTERLRVTTPDGEYSVYVGAGLMDQVPAAFLDGAVAARGGYSARCIVATNPVIGRLYADRVASALRAAHFDPRVIEIPEGERFKTYATVNTLYDALVEAQVDRGGVLFALGGGVVGDMAGFAAATYLRGIPLVQLPTTLLAMVDSGVGGKVAVDHPRGKNLIGAFKQPLAVLVDPQVLATLPDAEWRAGMAEVVKHGVIAGGELFAELESGDPQATAADWLAQAIRVKVDIVSRDPYERGERAKLNLGHTFAHAFEQLSDFSMRHGDAVSIGLVCATHLAVDRSGCRPELAERLEALLAHIGLPTRVPSAMSSAAILEAMNTDKKRADGRLRFILPRELGDLVVTDDVTAEQVLGVLERLR